LNTTASQLNKQIEIIKDGPTLVNISVGKLKSDFTLKNPTIQDAIVFDSYLINKLKISYVNTEVFSGYTDTGKLTSNARLQNPTPQDAIVFDSYLINKLKVPYVNVSVFSLNTTASQLNKQIEIVKGSTSNIFVGKLKTDAKLTTLPTNYLSVSQLQKQIEIIKNPSPKDVVVFDPYLIDRLKISYDNTEVFSLDITPTQLQKQLFELTTLPTNYLSVSQLQEQIEIVKGSTSNIFVGKLRTDAKLAELSNNMSVGKLKTDAKLINPFIQDAQIIYPTVFSKFKYSYVQFEVFQEKTQELLGKLKYVETFTDPDKRLVAAYGSIIKLSSLFNKDYLVDPNYRKKEPIQFWS
jgi:hypothetical protein